MGTTDRRQGDAKLLAPVGCVALRKHFRLLLILSQTECDEQAPPHVFINPSNLSAVSSLFRLL